MTPAAKTILLIEDDPLQIEMYQFKFEKDGFLFFASRWGQEGFALAQSKKPDIILLDLVLIGESGIDILKQLKANANTQAIPVIMLTNLAKKEMEAESKRLGVVAYIIKTQTTPGGLEETIKKILHI